MEVLGTHKIETQYVQHWVCDRCGKVVEPADWQESQEMLHWGMTGGYGSVWGDGTHVSIDLCQSCASVLLGEFVKYREGIQIGWIPRDS